MRCARRVCCVGLLATLLSRCGKSLIASADLTVDAVKNIIRTDLCTVTEIIEVFLLHLVNMVAVAVLIFEKLGDYISDRGDIALFYASAYLGSCGDIERSKRYLVIIAVDDLHLSIDKECRLIGSEREFISDTRPVGYHEVGGIDRYV